MTTNAVAVEVTTPRQCRDGQALLQAGISSAAVRAGSAAESPQRSAAARLLSEDQAPPVRLRVATPRAAHAFVGTAQLWRCKTHMVDVLMRPVVDPAAQMSPRPANKYG